MKEITLILRFVVIGFIYVILFRMIRVMFIDLKGARENNSSVEYALEVIDSPDLSGVSIGNIFPIHSATSIGRKENNQIVVNDPFVSGEHAIVSKDNGKIFLTDLNSTNGTILNGKKVQNEHEIFKGDTLEIGRIVFRIIG